ncbi:MAG: thiamine phosphate synthase [Chloroflexota bacterium]
MKTVLKQPIICLVTDRTACLGRPLEELVACSVRAGVNLVQLREKELPTRDLYQLGSSLLKPVREGGAALVINDRADVALALGADGVHLGSNSLPIKEVRKLVGNEMLIGASIHSLEEALSAEQEGADYLVLGTIFETRSHPGARPAGLSLVTQVSAATSIPVVAIGGINCSNAYSVMKAGAQGVAVITAILSAERAQAATRDLLIECSRQ